MGNITPEETHMKTTIHSIRIVGTLLTTIAVLAFCSSVWGLGETSGNFVLPYDVQWNGTTLPAGQYHFTLSSGELGGVLQIRDGRQNRKMLVVATGLGKTPNRSALTILMRNGKWHVASLALEGRGTTLEYALPAATKADREIQASIQVIAVQIVKS
jgi:hypothetical protein